MSRQSLSEAEEYVYVKAFRHWRTGKIVRASDFGKQAFRIRVKRRRRQRDRSAPPPG